MKGSHRGHAACAGSAEQRAPNDRLLIALAARRAVPDELYDMASASGAGPLARFVRVTLR